MKESVSVGVGIVDNVTIDSVNILNATKMAMNEAINNLSYTPDYVLIDGSMPTRMTIRQKCIVKGDRLCFTIACASIIAKVTRDHIMIDYDRVLSCYGFARHKGYGTDYHLQCLSEYGPSEIHRNTFAPVRKMSSLL